MGCSCVSKEPGMEKIDKLLSVLIFIIFSSFGNGLIAAVETSEPQLHPKDNAIKQWQALRFGLFIHFGAYAVPAGVWQGKQIEKLGEQIQRHADISQHDYEQLVKQFNPVNFDADEIARLAKQAGMRYIVLTTKHHDGFAMFDSQHTNYDIVDFTPYKKDLLKQLAEATKRHGLKLGLYYSTPDWHFNGPHPERNPDDGKISVFGKVSKANEDYQVAQLEELMTNYGDLVEVFFDMGEPTLSQSKRFRETVKKHQPMALINGRVMNNQGDFLTMPDNHVPDTPIVDYPWETPGTFYHTWGYKSWVKGALLEEQIGIQIRKLSDIASMGGNFLLNIGPKGDGSVLPYEKNVLIGIGSWLEKNSEAIFDTGLNPFLKLDWGQVSTGKNSLYLHVHQWPEDGQLVLPGLTNPELKARPLVDAAQKISVEQSGGNTVIDLKGLTKDPYLTIIKIDYDGLLSIVPEHSKVNEQGVIPIKGSRATKHGKFGKQSYRSMLKDFYRSWYIDIPRPGSYKVKITYSMKYNEKDFILASEAGELAFTLKGQDIQTYVGELKFDRKGIQKLLLKQGQSFELKTSIKEFKAQDQRYRGMNINIDSIELLSPGH